VQLRRFSAWFALLAGSVALAAAPAIALTLPPPTISFNGWQPGTTALGCTTEGFVTTCAGSNASPPSGNFTVTNWNLSLDNDPTVTNFFAIQNNLLGAQTFTITVQIPTAGTFGPPVQITGSVQGGATDANGTGGVTLSSSAPTAMYQALVDGSPVQTLLNDPQNFTSAVPFGSVSTGFVNFGPTNLGIAATSSIGITIKFTLSPGDIASFTSVFNLIPEPGTIVLLATGLVGMAHFGRRRA